MNGERQKIPQNRGSDSGKKGEARKTELRATGSFIAKRGTETPTMTSKLMEEVCEAENLESALKQVMTNKGKRTPGIDGIIPVELPKYLKGYLPEIVEQLLSGSYKPSPVRRVEILETDGIGIRKLGAPTALDRFIGQAVKQVMQRIREPTFSEHSYGFRPGRSAHQAVAQAHECIWEWHRDVEDIDLEKLFDKVNHDRLMSRLAGRIEDKRMLKLIRAFLNAGVMEDGLVSPTDEGTPQGGPLSPLLSNIVLDELDKELEKRGRRFVRYADDCNIYVRSRRAGERVMESVARFITDKLKLKVNRQKSAVGKPHERKFLGFGFTDEAIPKICISAKSLENFKSRTRELTRRGKNMEQIIKCLVSYLHGWVNYYGKCQTPWVLTNLDAWIRRRIRCIIWEQWKTCKRRAKELHKPGVTLIMARKAGSSSKGSWRLSRCKAIHTALPNAHLESLGLISLAKLAKV